MIIAKTILILEDDLKTLSKILSRLAKLEEDQPFYFSLVVLTDYLQVENYINNNPKAKFDIILLDRDCKLAGSFHVLDLERFGTDKVISISSVPEWNVEAQKRGVTKVILKDYQYLDDFADKVVKQIEEIVRKMPLIEDE
ncbi:MAG: hypothetical protein Q7S74_02495 [Nanoarchaeota archaeon]|nr:hypothetical protein [Nanoarchaeota archaeon]